MVSDIIRISSRDDRPDRVLDQVERVADFQRLPAKEALQLRLLAEEMTSMMRAIVGEVEGEFWIESFGKRYELHLRVDTGLDLLQREQLLSASTSGKNEAERGFMGKLRAFFAPTECAPLFFDLGPDANYANMTWSMRAYEQQVRQMVSQNRSGAAEAWDELEKSVVTHVADDVKVSIRSSVTEMIISKSFA